MGSVGLIVGARGRAGGPSSEGPVLSRFGLRRGAPTTSVPLRLCGFHPVLMRLLLVPGLTLFLLTVASALRLLNLPVRARPQWLVLKLV